MPPIDMYSTATMLQALPSLRKAPRFLQDVVFKNVITSDDEFIALDKIGDDMRVAPFVSPLAPGKIMKQRGIQTDRVTPAYLKPKFALDPKGVIRRTAGEATGGSLTAIQREAVLLSQGLEDQRNMCTRRVEVMCAEVIKTGGLVIQGEDYAPIVLDFDRDEDLTVELTGDDRWGEANVSPYDFVENAINLIGEKVGAAGNLVMMGKDAWALYRADPKVKAALDTTLGQSASLSLGMTAGDPGTAIFKGRDGNTEIYVYNDTYENTDGNKYPLFDPYGVSVIATGAAYGVQGYGAILDAELGYAAVPYLPKSWIPHDPAIRQLMTQCAPVPFFGRINATFYAKAR